MRLFEHPEFDQAVLRAAENAAVSEQFVEKDYYVTEILRIVSRELGDKVLFKGGTSLSKGWGLIQRFSEDIDLCLNRDRFESAPSKGDIDRTLKSLAETVGTHPGLTWREDERISKRGKGRTDYFEYAAHFDELPGLRSAVRLEPGIRSGSFPVETRTITSIAADFLTTTGQAEMADDLTGFEMPLLHFRRTFVEKLFALDGRVGRMLDGGPPLARDARHYADLFVLADTTDVRAMLESPEYEAIREDDDRNSREFFGDAYVAPPALSFASSPAFFPAEELRIRLAAEYEAQCGLLFSGREYPEFGLVLERLEELRHLL